MSGNVYLPPYWGLICSKGREFFLIKVTKPFGSEKRKWIIEYYRKESGISHKLSNGSKLEVVDWWQYTLKYDLAFNQMICCPVCARMCSFMFNITV